MAFQAHRYKGVARNGKIELEKGVRVPEGAEVIVLFEESKAPRRVDPARWDEAMRIIESFRGRLPVLPDAAFSTDSMYD